MTEAKPIASKPSGTPGWVKWHPWNERAFEPVTAWICDAAAKTGQRGLDLGCGTGLPALALARRVGPSGRVIGSDVSPEMLQAAADNAARAGLAQLELKEMSADSIAFGDAAFDFVTSSFMLMFRPAPAQVVSEVWRVLKPGGRFAVVVWDVAEENPFFTTVFQPVARFISQPASDPRGPGQFRLGGQELHGVLRAGGFEDIRLETLRFELSFESIAQHWECFSDMAPPVKAAVQNLAAPELERLQAVIAEGLQPYLVGPRVVLPASAICGLATK